MRKMLAALVFATLASASVSGQANAIAFDPGRIIDDVIFTNSSTMNVTQIQDFLNSKVPICDTDGTLPASDFGRPDLTHAQYASSRGWQSPPYICLKNFSENSKSSAQILYDVSQQYQINPQVFLVLLQKESGLITDTWPLDWQYRSATGYGCPDSTPGVCDSSYRGFTNQVTWAARLFRSVIDQSPSWYSPYIKGANYIQWNPNAACGGSTVNIQNWSTAALYDYTPYQPNAAALNAGYGTGDYCSAYGNRNFWLYFTNWFGTTIGAMHNGVDYSPVFDATFYLENNPDVMQATGGNAAYAFQHFITYGMREGRIGSANFNINSYRNANADLRLIYESNLPAYYVHFSLFGKNEGRITTGNVQMTPVTKYGGVDYSSVYDFASYLSLYPDLAQAYADNDVGAIKHFVGQGIIEGRQANSAFNVTKYRASYYDLRLAFGANIRAYYLHYITNCRREGRSGNNDTLGGITKLTGIDYSPIYSFDTYSHYNADLMAAFGTTLNDSGSLSHFVNYGMSEGRVASLTFNVFIYRARYPDLQAAFGNNLKPYYLHYITNGRLEGRIAI